MNSNEDPNVEAVQSGEASDELDNIYSFDETSPDPASPESRSAEGAGDSPGQTDDSASRSEPGEPGQSETQKDPAGNPAAPVAANAQKPLTQEELISALRAVAPQPQSQQQQQAPKQFTQEEIDKLLKRPKVTEEHLRRFGFEEPTEEQAAVLQEIAENSAQYGMRLAMAQMSKVLDDRLNPYLPKFDEMHKQHVQQVQAKTFESFTSKYPALKEYPELIRMAAKEILETNPETASLPNDQAEQLVVNRVAALLQKVKPDFSLTATPSAPANVGANVPNMASHTPGGRSQSPQKTGGGSPSEFDIY